MTIITENHPKWPFYSQLSKCAEITASGDGTHFGINCSYCPTIFTSWRDIEDFISHLQQQHADVLHTEGPQQELKPPKRKYAKKRKLSISSSDQADDSDDDLFRKRSLTTVDSDADNLEEPTDTGAATKDDDDDDLDSIKEEFVENEFVPLGDPLEVENCCAASSSPIKHEENSQCAFMKEEETAEDEPFESDISGCETEDSKIPSSTKLKKIKIKDDAINYELDLLSLENRDALAYIIEVHQQNPILWDKEHALYPIYSRKLHLYNEIVKEVYMRFKKSMTVKGVRKAFMGLQQMYSAILLGIKTSSKKGKTKKTKSDTSKLWCFQQLDFLRDQEITANATVVLTNDQQIQLAKIYEQHSLLWDFDNVVSHDQKRLLETLQQMLQETNKKLNLNLTLCQLRKCNEKLRKKYRDNRRTRLECEKNNANFVPTRPELYEKLRFLEPFTGPFSCDKCSEGYFQGYQYYIFKEHMAAHEGRLPYTCNICQKGFKIYKYLEVHMQRHNGEKSYGCSYCDKAFISASELKLHEYTHTGKKNYVCHICGLAFKTASGLLPHKATHDPNGKSFQCPHCPKKFSRKSLREHINTHQGERSSVCPVCGKGFVQRKTMLQHLQLHDKVKRYQCDLCDKRFAQKAGLCSHRRTQHDIVRAIDQSEGALIHEFVVIEKLNE